MQDARRRAVASMRASPRSRNRSARTAHGTRSPTRASASARVARLEPSMNRMYIAMPTLPWTEYLNNDAREVRASRELTYRSRGFSNPKPPQAPVLPMRTGLGKR